MTHAFNPHRRRRASRVYRKGATAVLAMLFLMLFTTLSVAMIALSNANVQGASNLSDVARAQDAAESGLRWMEQRFTRMQRPRTTVGNITASVAGSLWPTLQQAIVDDFSKPTVNGQTNWNQLQNANERAWTVASSDMTSSLISVDESGARFRLRIAQHPLYAGDSLDARYIHVTSTGTYRSAVRSVAMDFKIDKKIKFAVVGKVPIQIGRNTVIEGNVAMANPSKFPPIQILSDFEHFDTALGASVQAFRSFLKDEHLGYDGRVSVGNTQEYNAATSAGYTDYNQDGYIDEYDLFVKKFDNDGDRKISANEFTKISTGKMYEENLFALIDAINGPLFAGDVIRSGYMDNTVDNRDGYAKIRGTLTFAVTASAWQQQLGSNGSISDWIQGPIVPTDPGAPPVKFGVPSNDILDLSPSNFDGAAEGLRGLIQVGGSNPPLLTTVPTQGSTVIGKTIVASKANNGTATEKTPYGSTSYQATYLRPVYKNVTFRDCMIQKGTNALFDGCTFEGVTFVDMEHDIIVSGSTPTVSPSEGMTWSKTRISGDSTFSNNKVLLASGTPASGQMITKGSQKGNNIRFNNCTFKGPIAGTAATAYTHFSNSWEFTGATLFDNQWIDPNSGHTTATIVCPNTNIEMGSFTNPNAAPSTLKGVVVVGNIDIRGTSMVDGSIIVTGDGAGNTTLSYFGPSDSDTNPSAMPEGGFGRLDIRYNPTRALPDGINLPIDISANADTYVEGSSAY